jgi:hypothetical protein
MFQTLFFAFLLGLLWPFFFLFSNWQARFSMAQARRVNLCPYWMAGHGCTVFGSNIFSTSPWYNCAALHPMELVDFEGNIRDMVRVNFCANYENGSCQTAQTGRACHRLHFDNFKDATEFLKNHSSELVPPLIYVETGTPSLPSDQTPCSHRRVRADCTSCTTLKWIRAPDEEGAAISAECPHPTASALAPKRQATSSST